MPLRLKNIMKPKRQKGSESNSDRNSSSPPSPKPSTSGTQQEENSSQPTVNPRVTTTPQPPENTMLEVQRNNASQFPQQHKLPPSVTVTDNGASPMRFERNRLKSFDNWPCRFVSPKDLAAAGFYYIKFQDVVRCAFCSIEIGQWEQGDDPRSDHQRWQNNCPFLRARNVGNVPIDSTESSSSIPQMSDRENQQGEDTCGKYGIEVRPNSFPEREAGCTSNGVANGNSADLRKLGITPNRGPTYPTYATEAARMRSFQDWPRSMKQKPEELSAAGFFYIGKGDQTLCFHCGGGLKDWETSDDPWEQHAKWFSKCLFLEMVKGRDYINKVCGRDQEPASPSEASEANTANADASNCASVSKDVIENVVATTSEATASAKSTKEVNLCKICYQEEMGVVFLPCGHLVACVKCAPSLTTCAVCRKPLEATVRAFLS